MGTVLANSWGGLALARGAVGMAEAAMIRRAGPFAPLAAVPNKWYNKLMATRPPTAPYRAFTMEFTETRRLYQQLAAELKQRIESGRYPVGDKLPAEDTSPKR